MDGSTTEGGVAVTANTGYATPAAVAAATCVPIPADGGSNAVVGGVSGNVLIADQLNNRVIEVTRSGAIVWQFGDGTSTPGPTSIVGPNDAERIPGTGWTLMTGTGTPPGPWCSVQGDAGCRDDRVMIVAADGGIVWQYGAGDGGTAFDGGLLKAPATARYLPATDNTGFHVLIADNGNQRVLEVDQSKRPVWIYQPSGGYGGYGLVGPNGAERLANGHTLITDQAGNRVVEVDDAGSTAWQYGNGDAAVLSAPAFASRLASGGTLITDSNHQRVIVVVGNTNAGYSVPWTYWTSHRLEYFGNSTPTRAVRLANGNTLVTESFYDQVVEVGPDGGVVYTHGALEVAGNSGNLLRQPYDSKVIGDYTGLTNPGPGDAGP
jgi:hypothetical protein